MSLTKKNPLINVDVDGIIRRSIKQNLPSLKESKEDMNESYVLEPKQFKQVTEFVSQKTKNAHHDLYKGYAESLNKVSSEMDTVERTEVNSRHCDYLSLKKDEVYNLNAAWLHELYFANCFDPNSEIVMDSLAFLRLQRDFGTFEDWQRDFMACAQTAGNGWAVCGYHPYLRRYVNTFVSGHSGDIMLGLYPLIIVDMWEHAYYRDYLSDKKSYLVSQMREFNWDVIEERFQKAESIAQVMK